MLSSMFKNRTTVELLCVTGIMALLMFVDFRIGAIEWATQASCRLVPGLQSHISTVVGGLWMGLLVYSYFIQSRYKLVVRSKSYGENNLEKQKLINAVSGLANSTGFENVINDTALLLDYPHWSILGIEIANINSLEKVHGGGVAELVEVKIAKKIAMMTGSAEFLAHDRHGVFYLVSICEAEDEVAFRMDQIVKAISKIKMVAVANEQDGCKVLFNFALLKSNAVNRAVIHQETGGLAKRIRYCLSRSGPQLNSQTIVFNKAMEPALQRDLKIKADLRDAIQKGEIIPYFQPFININHNSVTGFDVLASWKHPILGTISPDEFVAEAARQGLLQNLTISILHQALEVAESWPQHIVLAINISLRDLMNQHFVSRLISTIDDGDVDPQRIEFGLTENAFLGETGIVDTAMSKFKDEGISISIDDSGTGHSKLRNLQILPFDKIKIDQSFLCEIAKNPGNIAIVKSMIALGKSLDTQKVAEGVKVEGNPKLPKEAGCRIGQGYFLAKPMQAREVIEFIQNQRHAKTGSMSAA